MAGTGEVGDAAEAAAAVARRRVSEPLGLLGSDEEPLALAQ